MYADHWHIGYASRNTSSFIGFNVHSHCPMADDMVIYCYCHDFAMHANFELYLHVVFTQFTIENTTTVNESGIEQVTCVYSFQGLHVKITRPSLKIVIQSIMLITHVNLTNKAAG